MADVSAKHPCAHEADFNLFAAAMSEIKDTLRDMKDLLTSNAVLEEQAVRFSQQIYSLEKRIHKVELDVAQNHGAAKWVERVVWAVVSLALTGMLVTAKAG